MQPIIKDKNGKPIFEGKKFKFKLKKELPEPPLDLIGSFDWNDEELRYEIDIWDHEDYICLSYVCNGVMFDFELIDLSVPDNNFELQKLFELTEMHKKIMIKKNILVSVYTNASGFLWQAMMVDSGTGLGDSGFTGDCELSGTFTTYEKALENALNLMDKCDLDYFEKYCPKKYRHWSNYVSWVQKRFN